MLMLIFWCLRKHTPGTALLSLWAFPRNTEEQLFPGPGQCCSEQHPPLEENSLLCKKILQNESSETSAGLFQIVPCFMFQKESERSDGTLALSTWSCPFEWQHLLQTQLLSAPSPPQKSQLIQGGESSCQSTERECASGWILSGIATYSTENEVEDITNSCVGESSFLGQSSFLERMQLRKGNPKQDLDCWGGRNLEEIFAIIVHWALCSPSLPMFSDGLIFGEWVDWGPQGAVGTSGLKQGRACWKSFIWTLLSEGHM